MWLIKSTFLNICSRSAITNTLNQCLVTDMTVKSRAEKISHSLHVQLSLIPTLSPTGLFFLLQDWLSSIVQSPSMADCMQWGWGTEQSSLLSWNSQSNADTHMQNRVNKMAPVICHIVHLRNQIFLCFYIILCGDSSFEVYFVYMTTLGGKISRDFYLHFFCCYIFK